MPTGPAELGLPNWAYPTSKILTPASMLMFGNPSTSELAEIRSRLAQIDLKLDAILNHLGLSVGDQLKQLDDELTVLLRRGKKLDAVARYKQVTGCTLAEAKKYVESLDV